VVRLPRNVSPAAAARRSLLVDVCLGILVGGFAVIVAAGIGVVGFIALLAALLLALWYLVETGVRAGRRRRRQVNPLSRPRPAGSRRPRER
jgi:hypothetical protein